MRGTELRFFLSTIMVSTIPLTAIAREPESVIQGSSWTCEAPHGNGNVYAADIVRHRDTLLMYYGGQGRDGHDRIHLATSADHTTWKPQGVVFAPEGINHVNDPSVVIVNGKFYMYYTRANVGVTDSLVLRHRLTDERGWIGDQPSCRAKSLRGIRSLSGVQASPMTEVCFACGTTVGQTFQLVRRTQPPQNLPPHNVTWDMPSPKTAFRGNAMMNMCLPMMPAAFTCRV